MPNISRLFETKSRNYLQLLQSSGKVISELSSFIFGLEKEIERLSIENYHLKRGLSKYANHVNWKGIEIGTGLTSASKDRYICQNHGYEDAEEFLGITTVEGGGE